MRWRSRIISLDCLKQTCQLMKEKEGRWSSMALRKGIRSLHDENWPLHCHCRMSVSPRLHRNMSLPRDFPHISHIGTQQPEGTQKLSVRGARQVCFSQIWLQAEQFLLGCLISNSCQILSVLPISRHLLVFHFWCEDFLSFHAFSMACCS